MAEQKMTVKFPRQSITYLLLCLTGVLIFIFAGILPNSRTMAELSTKTAVARFQLEEQRELSPFRKSLQEKSEKKESEILPLPAKGSLAQAKINTLPMTFSTAAKVSGMTLVSAIPNLNALTGNAQSLSINVVLRGKFPQPPEIYDPSRGHPLRETDRRDRNSAEAGHKGIQAEDLGGRRMSRQVCYG